MYVVCMYVYICMCTSIYVCMLVILISTYYGRYGAKILTALNNTLEHTAKEHCVGKHRNICMYVCMC